MTRRILGAVAVLAIVGTAQPAAAQFALGYTDLGVTVGLGGIGDASLAFGGRFEKAIRAAPEGFGTGVLGIQVSADYYSWSGAGYSWSYIPVGATVNYHFDLANDRLDPFLGLGLGYSIVSCDYDGFGGQDLCSNSTIYFIGRAGGRYFFSPNMALYADIGEGAALLNVGVTLKVGG